MMRSLTRSTRAQPGVRRLPPTSPTPLRVPPPPPRRPLDGAQRLEGRLRSPHFVVCNEVRRRVAWRLWQRVAATRLRGSRDTGRRAPVRTRARHCCALWAPTGVRDFGGASAPASSDARRPARTRAQHRSRANAPCKPVRSRARPTPPHAPQAPTSPQGHSHHYSQDGHDNTAN
jgi:hypothetical protein